MELARREENELKQAPVVKAFFQAEQIQNLEDQDKNKLVQNLQECTDEENFKGFLEKYQKNGLLNLADLQHQVQVALNDKRFDISTIISQVLKNKAPEETTSQLITKHMFHLQVLKNYSMSIESKDSLYTIMGKITSIKLSENIQLEIENKQQKSSLITLILKNKFIKKIQIFEQKSLLLGYSIRQLKPTSNKLVFQNMKVTVNHEQLGQYVSVLSSANNTTYTIHVFFNKTRKIQSITFIDILRKQTTFSITQDQSKNIVVNNQKWTTNIYYEQFCKYFIINYQQHKTLSYQNQKQSNSHVKITKKSYDTTSMFQVLQDIYKAKSELIGCLLSNNYHKLLVNLIDKLIIVEDFSKQTVFIEDQLRQHTADDVNIMLKDLVDLNKKLNKNVTFEKILEEVLIQTNCALLIPKSGTVDTVRILHLLTEAQNSLKLVQGKQIISFYGATGSGKSTSVNYFIGIPLKKQNNSFSDKVICIDDNKLKELKDKQNIATIGKNIGTSQTIYSKGYKAITVSQELQPLLKNVVFLDNPGFYDTRGTDYQICTSMSIDMGIQKSDALRAIVLLIPYPYFTGDKANNVVSMIETMKQRFPQIIQKNTQTFQSFHILITKHDGLNHSKTFQQRINKHIKQQNESLQRLNNQNENILNFAECHFRRDVFIAFLQMYRNDRIQFINVSNKIERDKFLNYYLRNNTIVPKSKYRKFMQSGGQKISFMKQLSKSAHTWSIMLLNPFYKVIPQKIEYCQTSILKYQKDIFDRKKEIQQIQDSLSLANHQIQDSTEKLNQLKNVDAEGSLANLTFHNDITSTFNKTNKSNKNKLSQVQKKIEEMNEKIKNQNILFSKQKDEVKKLEKTIDSLSNKIKDLKTGDKVINLVEVKYRLGTQVIFNVGRTKQAKMQAFRQVKCLYNLPNQQKIIVGKSQVKLSRLAIVSRDFALVPHKDFDPDKYIESINKQSKFLTPSHQAQIQARNVILKRINYSQDRKSIALDIRIYLNICDTEQQLPYFRISHKIANQIINSAQISNLQSQLKTLKLDLLTQKNKSIKTQQQLQTHKKTLKILNDDKTSTQKTILNTQNSAKNSLQKLFQNSIRISKQNQKRYQQNITDLKKMNIDSYKNIQQSKNDLSTYKLTYRRIAYLINDQIKKQIPQSLKQFITLYLKNPNNPQNQSKSDQKKDCYKNFRAFLSLYNNNIQLHHITQVLTDAKYRSTKQQKPSIKLLENKVNIQDIEILEVSEQKVINIKNAKQKIEPEIVNVQKDQKNKQTRSLFKCCAII